MKKILYIIFLVTLSLSKGLAQNIDSLKIQLKNAKDDTTRCNILSEMVDAEGDDKIWTKYNEQLRVLAERNLSKSQLHKKIYLKHLASAFNNVGVLAQQNGDITKSLEYFHRGLKIQEQIGDKTGIANSLCNIGVIYQIQGNITKALEYYPKSLQLREEIGDKSGIANSLNNMGEIYRSLGDIPKALEYYHKSLKIQEEIGDKIGIGYSLNNVGNIFMNQDNLPMALEYYHKSLRLREVVNDKKGIATSLGSIATVYSRQGNITKALDYYQKGLKIQEEIGNKEGIANTLNGIGTLYGEKGDPSISSKEDAIRVGNKKALEEFKKSLKISEEIGDKSGMAISLNSIAHLMTKKGQINEALYYAQKGMQTAKELGFPDKIKLSANTLKTIFKIQNKYSAAFEMYELEIQMRDSINNEQTKKASIQKQFQYEYEKRTAADSVAFAKENEIKEVEISRQKAEIKVKQNQQTALYGGLLLVLVFAGFMYNRFKVTQKQKTVIEQQKTIVEKAHVLLEEKNNEIVASIRYAKRIQEALLTSHKYMERNIERLKQTNES